MVLIFQPAEEQGEGAKQMIKKGVLEKAEAIFSLHLFLSLDSGVVASRSGDFLVGCGFFKAVIHAKGGHAAIPQDSVTDPILVVSATVISLQHIVSQEVDPLDMPVVFVTMLDGGTGLNAIPNSVSIVGTYRYVSKKGFYALAETIQEVRNHQLWRPSDSSCRTPSKTNTTGFATCLDFW
ncbi:unnamed protein product [Lactuca saligna]|uniref:Peptidase M20 dimerisation domain-containing protein n=1 Tax=Lactuca saligna TaxID=75948 RepID=A0AA36EBH2_LACSI|nr:unnamed protein product [Lactuca saligna]